MKWPRLPCLSRATCSSLAPTPSATGASCLMSHQAWAPHVTLWTLAETAAARKWRGESMVWVRAPRWLLLLLLTQRLLRSHLCKPAAFSHYVSCFLITLMLVCHAAHLTCDRTCLKGAGRTLILVFTSFRLFWKNKIGPAGLCMGFLWVTGSPLAQVSAYRWTGFRGSDMATSS